MSDHEHEHEDMTAPAPDPVAIEPLEETDMLTDEDGAEAAEAAAPLAEIGPTAANLEALLVAHAECCICELRPSDEFVQLQCGHFACLRCVALVVGLYAMAGRKATCHAKRMVGDKLKNCGQGLRPRNKEWTIPALEEKADAILYRVRMLDRAVNFASSVLFLGIGASFFVAMAFAMYALILYCDGP